MNKPKVKNLNWKKGISSLDIPISFEDLELEFPEVVLICKRLF